MLASICKCVSLYQVDVERLIISLTIACKRWRKYASVPSGSCKEAYRKPGNSMQMPVSTFELACLHQADVRRLIIDLAIACK